MSTIHDSPAWRLFHSKYRFSVPYIHFHSADMLQQMGQVQTGDPRLDQSQLNDLVTTEDTAAVMAMHFDNNVQIKNLSEADAVSIYRDIQDYLAGWQRAAREEYNLGDVPRDWISRFEQLAIALKPLVDVYRANNPQETKPGFLSGRKLFSPLAREETERPKEPTRRQRGTRPSHPVVDTIEEHLHRRGMIDKD